MRPINIHKAISTGIYDHVLESMEQEDIVMNHSVDHRMWTVFYFYDHLPF
jgi:hypothetical protein